MREIRLGPHENEPTADKIIEIAGRILKGRWMHDAKNRPLKVGDRVLIPAVVTELQATADYCNVAVESAIGRRPDKSKERVSAINTGVLLRSNPDDENNVQKWASTEGTWLG